MKRAQVKHKDPFHYQLLAAVYDYSGCTQKELAGLVGIAYFNVNHQFARSITRCNKYSPLIRVDGEESLQRYFKVQPWTSTQARAWLREQRG